MNFDLPELFVITNDDGIDAPGIRTLDRITGERGIVVAPAGPQSGCSHRATLDAPIYVDKLDDRRYAVHGTPADCVRLALTHFVPEAKLVLSGINAGGNLGADVYLSGTCAAAREATFHGVRGIALSQYLKRDVRLDWERSARYAVQALENVFARGHEAPGFWNINLPAPGEGEPEPVIVHTHTCTAPLPIVYELREGAYHYVYGHYPARQRTPDADVDVCFRGNIAVTRVPL